MKLVNYFTATLFTLLIKIVCLLVTIAYYTLAERKIMASVQRRLGPNVVGFWGLLQPLADGLKLFGKELVIPTHANSRIFIFAPMGVLGCAFLAWAVIPFCLFDHSVGMSAALVRDCLLEGTDTFVKESDRMTQEQIDEFMQEHQRQMAKIFTDFFDTHPELFGEEFRKYDGMYNLQTIAASSANSAGVTAAPLVSHTLKRSSGWIHKCAECSKLPQKAAKIRTTFIDVPYRRARLRLYEYLSYADEQCSTDDV